MFRHFRGDTRKLPFVVLAHDKTIDIAIVGVEGTKDEFALIGYLDRTEHRTVAVPHVGGIWGRTFRDGYNDTDTSAYYPSNHFDQPWYGARDLSLRYSVDAGVLMMHSPKDPIQRHRPGRHADSVGDWTTYIFSAETEPGHSGKPVFVTRNNPELPPQQHRYSLAGVLVAEDQSIGHTPGGLSIERERVTLTRSAYVQRLVDKAVTELTAQGRKTLTSR